MFKQVLLQIGLEAAIKALKDPKNKKFKKFIAFLFSEKVSNTIADFTAAYAYAEEQFENEEEGGAE